MLEYYYCYWSLSSSVVKQRMRTSSSPWWVYLASRVLSPFNWNTRKRKDVANYWTMKSPTGLCYKSGGLSSVRSKFNLQLQFLQQALPNSLWPGIDHSIQSLLISILSSKLKQLVRLRTMAAHHRVSSSLPSLLLFMMTVSAAVLVLVQPSVAVCNRYLRSNAECGSYVDYFNAYDSQVDQHYKVLDGVEAQISYINLANRGRSDAVRILLLLLISLPFIYQIPWFSILHGLGDV